MLTEKDKKRIKDNYTKYGGNPSRATRELPYSLTNIKKSLERRRLDHKCKKKRR